MTLRVGSEGSAVKELQRRLNAELDASLTVDGKYGAKTEAAVKEYQKAAGLKTDGIAGPATLGKLGIEFEAVKLTCEDLKQFSQPWADKSYGKSGWTKFRSAGCGCLSATIIYRALFKPKETAAESVYKIADEATAKGYRKNNAGTSAGIFGILGMKKTRVYTAAAAEEAIRSGKFVAVCVKKGWSSYKGSGHWVVIYGIDGDTFLVRDVGSSASSRQRVKTSDWKYVKQAYAVE